MNSIVKIITNLEDTKKEKAKLFYIKGKVLDFLPNYEKTAEDYLNKSVHQIYIQIKLNPVNGDCWNCLAHVLYKKKDF